MAENAVEKVAKEPGALDWLNAGSSLLGQALQDGGSAVSSADSGHLAMNNNGWNVGAGRASGSSLPPIPWQAWVIAATLLAFWIKQRNRGR